MSTPHIVTEQTDPRVCRLCGLTVPHRMSHTAWGEYSEHWCPEPHDAPCGAKCFGGGARGREGIAALRAKALHGQKGSLCGCPAATEPSDG